MTEAENVEHGKDLDKNISFQIVPIGVTARKEFC